MSALRVALTGGIGSGKTTVSDLLAGHGAVIIDADLLAREVVGPGTPGLTAVVERFGEHVLSEGGLDRTRLGAIVFADPDARRDLEKIIHPAVRRRAAEIEASASGDAVVVHVIPLLVETQQQQDFDLVVVVDVDHETQVERLIARSGFDVAEAERRISAQAGRDQRLAVADVVLDNGGGRDELVQQVDRLWNRIARTDRSG